MPRIASRTGRARTADVFTDSAIGFADMMLSEPIFRGLQAAGFERPSPIQLKAIPVGRFGSDLIAQAKSGTGKTCVFAVIALESVTLARKAPQVLVLAPTREIAHQIRDVISTIGAFCPDLKCEPFIGGTSLTLDQDKVRDCHVVVGSPGRIVGLIADGFLDTARVKMLILDEADKLLQGAFVEQVSFIQASLPERKQVLAFSATYTRTQRETLSKWMRDPNFVLISTDEVSLEGVTQYYQEVSADPGDMSATSHPAFAAYVQKLQSLIQILGSVPFHQCLVFMNNRSRAQELVSVLAQHGYPAAAISGDMPQQQRNAAMAGLRNLQLRVLVSTDLTARGVDVENVNVVINMDLPADAETYIHRVGRTGRFGTRGLSITLATTEELGTLRKLITQLKTIVRPLARGQTPSNNAVEDKSGDGGQAVATVADSHVPDVLDDAHVKQFEKLQQKRDAAVTTGVTASDEAMQAVSRLRKSASRAKDDGCGLRISFADGSTNRKEDREFAPQRTVPHNRAQPRSPTSASLPTNRGAPQPDNPCVVHRCLPCRVLDP